MTAKAGLNRPDPEYGPLWAVGAAWVDVNNDGRLDLFVVNYLQWDYRPSRIARSRETQYYCHPKFYKGLPNQLFLNNGDGTFTDVSAQAASARMSGRAWESAMADYDGDGRPDLFVTNDGYYNFLFHNVDGKNLTRRLSTQAWRWSKTATSSAAWALDFRDFNNDGYPDIAFVALNNDTFPLFQNTGKGDFEEITAKSGMATLTRPMAGFGAGLYDFDNDGWKDLFITRGHVDALPVGMKTSISSTLFFGTWMAAAWMALTQEAGLNAHPAARHRGCAFGDLDGDGRVDVVVTALGRDAEIWMNRSEGSGHWLDIALEGTKSNRDGIGAVIKVVTNAGAQYNHMTTAVGYASSSDGPVHFGLGRGQHGRIG